MKIKETIERDCCNPEKDLKPIGSNVLPPFSGETIYVFCVHCGQWWYRDPDSTIDGPRDYTYKKANRLY